MPYVLPFLIGLISLEDPLVGLPDVAECQLALKINYQWQAATTIRMQHSVSARERRHLKLALEEGELIRIAWNDLYVARSRPDLTAMGIPYYCWVRLEIGDHRWKLRSMPPPIPWWWATEK